MPFQCCKQARHCETYSSATQLLRERDQLILYELYASIVILNEMYNDKIGGTEVTVLPEHE